MYAIRSYYVQRIKYVFLCENQEVKEMKLRLNKQVIDRAKDYAHIYNISLSKMIEYYLECITKQKSVATEVTPLVESLSGVIHLDVIFDYTKGYSVCLAGKYKKTIKDTNIIIDRVARREPFVITSYSIHYTKLYEVRGLKTMKPAP